MSERLFVDRSLCACNYAGTSMYSWARLGMREESSAASSREAGSIRAKSSGEIILSSG